MQQSLLYGRHQPLPAPKCCHGGWTVHSSVGNGIPLLIRSCCTCSCAFASPPRAWPPGPFPGPSLTADSPSPPSLSRHQVPELGPLNPTSFRPVTWTRLVAARGQATLTRQFITHHRPPSLLLSFLSTQPIFFFCHKTTTTSGTPLLRRHTARARRTLRIQERE